MQEMIIIGGGLAGSEAAWQAASRGIRVKLFEMRPNHTTGAHQTGNLAELICSNSLGSKISDRASGLLKDELRMLGSLLLECAEATEVPAGGALAVDRDAFSSLVTEKLSQHPNIAIIREEVTTIPDGPVIIASGPLTSEPLSAAIQNLTGQSGLAFFDAIAPIIAADSIDLSIAFRASRYDRGEDADGDYINCPFDKEQYYTFVEALKNAERIQLRSFETAIEEGVNAGLHTFFEGCLPAEVIASRGDDSLAFGPMRPVGIIDPKTNRRPYAVIQLRQDNLAGSMYNMVGFQTNLKFPEQKRVFQMIPGLENARFIRYGQMHRNTFIASPLLLTQSLQFKYRPDLYFAGQLTGVEGYMGNVATGLLAGINLSRHMNGQAPLVLPPETMLGSLCRFITSAPLEDFQPMKANFGIIPPLETAVKGKRNRAQARAKRAIESLQSWMSEHELG